MFRPVAFRFVTHKVTGFVFSHGWFWKLVRRVPGLREWINGVFISDVVNSTPPRPYPFSLWSPGSQPVDYHIGHIQSPAEVTNYVSWTGLVDRGYTGRHLPPAPLPTQLPALVDLKPLFARRKDAAGHEVMIPSNTSALFCFFAQWFTDSFLRTDPTDARRNTSNHEIDLCQIYGLNAAQADILRSKVGGELRMRSTARGELLPFLYQQGFANAAAPLEPIFASLPYADGLDAAIGSLTTPQNPANSWALTPDRRNLTYATGLERGNSTIFYASISTIFAREHNRLARLLRKQNPSWDDDRLFALARNTNIVQLLRIIIEEYINHLSGAKFKIFVEHHYAERQRWYRTNRICVEFDLLYRWHSLPPDMVKLDGWSLANQQFRYNNELVEAHGPEAIIHAASHTVAGRIGVFNTPFFLLQADENTVSFGRMFQLASFNAYRKHFGMAPYKTMAELAGDPETTALLNTLYPGGVDDVELVVGLLAEDRYAGAPLGDLMRTMVGVDAFSQALTNPLLSENVFGEAAFGAVGLAAINQTNRFAQLVRRNAASSAPPCDARFSIGRHAALETHKGRQ